jgi:hypothetical protein
LPKLYKRKPTGIVVIIWLQIIKTQRRKRRLRDIRYLSTAFGSILESPKLPVEIAIEIG